jgi:2'-5' RNA ligase
LNRERSIRTFVALEIEEPMRTRLAQAIQELRPLLPGLRFVTSDVHLTLRFLGGSRPEQLDRMLPALAAAARDCPPLEARIGGLGAFPERGAPRVLFVGLLAPPQLGPLQVACERAARSAGFLADGRSFRPHLTLGRWRDPAQRPQFPPLELGFAALRNLVLFRSEPQRGGSRYTALGTFSLAGGS